MCPVFIQARIDETVTPVLNQRFYPQFKTAWGMGQTLHEEHVGHQIPDPLVTLETPPPCTVLGAHWRRYSAARAS